VAGFVLSVAAVSNHRSLIAIGDVLIIIHQKLRKDNQCTAVPSFDIKSGVPGGRFSSAAGGAAAAWGLYCF
jgi:hypothetical protein